MTMGNFGLQKRDLSVSKAGSKIEAALEKLRQAEVSGISRRRGRLIFGLDLTGSREKSLQQARIATSAMFDTIKAFGAVAVKLIYFRGTDECRESKWYDDPAILSESMRGLSCETGETQIARLLRCVLSEEEIISGVVFVGDHSEDDPCELLKLAHALGQRSMPLFIFHECADHDERSLQAKPIFKQMAAASNGAYMEFRPDSGATLREMLTSVAAVSAGGVEGLERLALPKTSEARRLRGRLLLGSGGDPKRMR